MGKIKIVYKKVEDLTPSDYNPRTITPEDRTKLKNSIISSNGLIDPIIINSNPKRKGIIIGGHQRFDIALELKYKEVPCIELNLTLEKEKEMNIRLNDKAGEFDFEKLKEHFSFEELESFDFNHEEHGFNFEDEDEEPEKVTKEIFGSQTKINLKYDLETYGRIASILNGVCTKYNIDSKEGAVMKLAEFYENGGKE